MKNEVKESNPSHPSHPTDQATPSSKPSRLPPHLKRRFRPGGDLERVQQLLETQGLHTVCQSAHCPNQGECFGHGTATFLILGDTCTRHCRFCAIPGERKPGPLDPGEPARVLEAVKILSLRYVVITSVTRDDLALGGAEVFAECITKIRAFDAAIKVEVLTPDFQNNEQALRLVLDAGPDVFNHNLETVPALYPSVRPEADYARSLAVLQRAVEYKPAILSKSGIMVGLGETPEQVLAVMDDLRAVQCDLLTIGQYLAPSPLHHPVVEFVAPAQFDLYAEEAKKRGFRHVASAPFVRSSYNAEEGFAGQA